MTFISAQTAKLINYSFAFRKCNKLLNINQIHFHRLVGNRLNAKRSGRILMHSDIRAAEIASESKESKLDELMFRPPQNKLKLVLAQTINNAIPIRQLTITLTRNLFLFWHKS